VTIIEEAHDKAQDNDDNEDWIPPLFGKSGYQGYKIFIDRYTLKSKQ